MSFFMSFCIQNTNTKKVYKVQKKNYIQNTLKSIDFLIHWTKYCGTNILISCYIFKICHFLFIDILILYSNNKIRNIIIQKKKNNEEKN